MLDNKIKVGFIGWYSPDDKKALSGTPHKISELLESLGCDISWIKITRSFKYRLFEKVARGLNRILGSIMIDCTHSVIGAKYQSETIDMVNIQQCDVIFAPVCCEALYTLKTDKPIIYLSDATFGIMVDYYFKGLSNYAINQGNQVEQKAMDTATEIIVSSQWAANSAINDYHQDPSKVHVIEFGANIDDKDIIEKKFVYEGHLHLLFLGVDWKRKGGQIAVDACKWLNENGVPATLHIVGIRELDDSIKQLSYIDYVGFLNKNLPEQYNRLVKVIKQCHCMLLPTLAECSAIAFCESSANGLPVFSHLTGGVGNYIYDGRNGYLLPLGSTGADFGAKIKACLESGELEKMSVTARDVYREKLNWNVWAQKVEVIIRNILEEKNGRNK